MKTINLLTFVFVLMLSASLFALPADSTKHKMHHMKSDTTKMHSEKDSMKHAGHKMMMMTDSIRTAGAREGEIWNKFCPVRGGEIDATVKTVRYKGKNVGFCCPGCDEKFMQNPEKYIKNLNEDGSKFIGVK